MHCIVSAAVLYWSSRSRVVAETSERRRRRVLQKRKPGIDESEREGVVPPSPAAARKKVKARFTGVPAENYRRTYFVCSAFVEEDRARLQRAT